MREVTGPCRLGAVGVITALGVGDGEIWPRLLAGDQSRFTRRSDLVKDREMWVGEIREGLTSVPDHFRRYECRNNQIVLAAVRQIEGAVQALRDRVGPGRIGIVMGSSTSGAAAAEAAIDAYQHGGSVPGGFDYVQLEFGGLAQFVAAYLGLSGPRYTLSTACSSGAKAVASARRLLATDVCDAVIAGGADSLCALTASGFSALGAVADDLTNPFSANRRGLTLGEGAAVFVVTREAGGVQVIGVGEASDAYHISAPDPAGSGATAAMRAALAEAGLEPAEVAYLNLHGTGTPLNDAMESEVVARVLGADVPCSSTKQLVGHTLGASGAVELAFCWLMLEHVRGGRLPLLPHCWDGVQDDALPRLQLASAGQIASVGPTAVVMSNSFGFGGNNCAVILAREDLC